jgi:hypothetical protein
VAGSINASTLLGWYQSFFGGTGTDPRAILNPPSSAGGTSALAAPTTPAIQYAPTAPWNQHQPSQSQLVQKALSGSAFFNPSAAVLDLPGASADYKNLFALYSGLNTLFAIANQAGNSKTSALQLTQLSTAFDNGMQQLGKYLGQTTFSKLKLTAGVDLSSQTSTVTTPQQATSYQTPPLNTSGDVNAVVPAFSGNVQFTVTVQLGSTVTNVPIDLSGMGSTPRTMGAVVAYLNSQMKAAGVFVSFSSVAIPATPDTIQVGGKSVTVSSGQSSWALKMTTNPAETVSLSAPSTGPAVYVGQTVGNASATTSATGAKVPADAQSQLLKFNASGSGVLGPSTPAHAASDQVSTTALGSAVSSAQATAVAPDGSVYVLANVTTEPDGSTPPGGQDVALRKYDSAGKLIFSTDLGSAASASGLSLAVSPDGSQVAIAGSVTGSLTPDRKVNDPTGSNTFVSVYDSLGNQVWTQQDDGLTPNQGNGVAFGADGSVYVTGQAQTTTASQGAQGPSNSFLQVFSPTGASVSKTQIATGGTNTSASVAVDGTNVYVAGVQNGDAVVTEYDMSNPAAPLLVATRDLGGLGGGNVAGISVQSGVVYVAGSTRSALANAGGATTALSGGGLNGFAATLSTGLAPTGSDAVAYYGGSGDTRVTGMSVANGDVYLTGSATGSLPNEAAIGAKDGFVAGLDVGAGTVDFAQRFTGLDGQVAPTSIAVAPAGASILDQLGLPQGVVDGPVSSLIASTTPVKAGDSFQIAVSGGAPVTIKVSADDTMTSLAAKIAQASGFNITAKVVTQLGGATALQLQPASPNAVVKLIAGPAGQDALAALGLKGGLLADIHTTTAGVKTLQGSGTPIYGLGLPATLDLSSAADINTAKVQLAGAISVVESAYQNLKNAATPAAVLALQKAQASGQTPKYLANEIANYQSALTRLTAGSNSSTGSLL